MKNPRIRRVNMIFAGGYTLVVILLLTACYFVAPRLTRISRTIIKGHTYDVYRSDAGRIIYKEVKND